MKSILSFMLCLLLIAPACPAQQADPWSPAERLRFAQAAFYEGNHSISLTECQTVLNTLSPAPALHDSFRYLSALNLYMLERREEASAEFNLVGEQHPQLWKKAGLFLDYRLLMRGEAEKVIPLNRARKMNLEPGSELKSYFDMCEAASCILLKNDQAFDSLRKLNYPAEINEAFSGMQAARDKMQHTRRKSPLLAGLMSLLIPGSGKIYAGNIGSGISTLMFTGLAGVQAWEGWRHDGGWKSPQFLAFTGLAAAWYFSGIYGAIIHSKRYNAVIQTDFRDKVLLSVSVPLERYFSR